MAYLTGFQLKGNEVIINQMSIASGRIGSEHLRTQTLLGLYSPRRNTYNLTLPYETMARPFDRNFGNLGGSGAWTQSVGVAIWRSRGYVSTLAITQTFVVNSVP